MVNSIKNISLRGLSVCVPNTISKTMDYEWITLDERKLFIKNTGIEERRVASQDVTTSDMCEKAANELLNKLNWDRSSVDVLIFVSQSPDYFLPATSAILQNKLGLNKSVIAFDVNLGCSGYVYGLYLLSSLLTSGVCKRGILLAGDKSTLSTNYNDKSTYPLFGDAGSATALEYNPSSDPIIFDLHTDGSGFESIIIKDGGSRNHISEKSLKTEKISEGIERAPKHLILDGVEVFNFALKAVASSINNMFEKDGFHKEEVDFFILHQANKLINETVRKKCKLDLAKTPYSISKYGNTSSASIPLTMLYALKSDLETKSLNLFLSGFGVGYSWGNCLLKTKSLTCTEILEL